VSKDSTIRINPSNQTCDRHSTQLGNANQRSIVPDWVMVKIEDDTTLLT
jgi:hypothetical protein